MRAKMKAVAEELVKLNGDTSIVTPSNYGEDVMLVRVAGKYTVQFTAERHGVGCELTVDGNAGTYYGPDSTADKPRPEPWENHCSRRLDKALARLAKREFGFECYPPSPLA